MPIATAVFSNRRQNIGGVSIVDIVKRFGTPTYVYDMASIAQKVADLKAFDVVRYAQKANSNIAILDRLRRLGVLVDAVSEGEVRRALAAGYPAHGLPHPIVFTADVFDRPSLELVTELGLHVNCGSPDMIDQLGEVFPGASITLRINPGFGHGHSRKVNTGGPQSKHGIWFDQVDDCLRRADRHNMVVTGLHMHIGSGTDLDHLSQVSSALEKVAIEIGRTLQSISAGGGLPVPYQSEQTYVDLEQYFSIWNAARNRLQDKFGHSLKLESEPGRYLVAESGFLIAEIRAIKEMGDNTFYLLDTGFNDLARPILYGSYHPISIAHQSARGPKSDIDVIVGGPLCESGDIFTQEEGGIVSKRRLPSASIGDMLVIEVAGAYGFTMASNYNSRYRAEEVLLEQGELHSIRQRETFEDLIRCEKIPVFLH